MRRSLAAAFSLFTIAALTITPGRATTPVFADWVRVGAGATEPGIHIAPDGTIFVDGPAGLGAHSHMWRSTDAGATFQATDFGTALRRLPGGGDSDVAIRTTPSGQRVYFLDLWAGSNSLSVSEDNGTTWTTGTPFTSLPLSDRQWIGLGRANDITGLDTVYVLYALIQAPNQVMIARSRTGGLTWETHLPAPALNAARGFTGQLVTDGDRFLGFVWEDGSRLSAAYSTDEGETWGSTEIATNVGGLIPGVALDGEDMYAVWVDRTFYAVEFAVSHDRGATWSAPTTLSQAGTSNIFPWVDARNGKVAVAWYGADGISGNPNNVEDDTVWTTRYAESLDRGTTWSATVEVGPAKTGKICTRGLSCDLDGSGGRELGDFLSVAIRSDGMSVVGFGGRVAQGVKVAVQTS